MAFVRADFGAPPPGEADTPSGTMRFRALARNRRNAVVIPSIKGTRMRYLSTSWVTVILSMIAFRTCQSYEGPRGGFFRLAEHLAQDTAAVHSRRANCRVTRVFYRAAINMFSVIDNLVLVL